MVMVVTVLVEVGGSVCSKVWVDGGVWVGGWVKFGTQDPLIIIIYS